MKRIKRIEEITIEDIKYSQFGCMNCMRVCLNCEEKNLFIPRLALNEYPSCENYIYCD